MKQVESLAEPLYHGIDARSKIHDFKNVCWTCKLQYPKSERHCDCGKQLRTKAKYTKTRKRYGN